MPKLMSLFIRLFVGLAGGSSSVCVCLSLLSPGRESFVQQDRRVYINTDVGFACRCCAEIVVFLIEQIEEEF